MFKRLIKAMENRSVDVYHDNRKIGNSYYEFLIRRVENFDLNDKFDIPRNQYENVFTPNSYNYTKFEIFKEGYCGYKFRNSPVRISSEFSDIKILVDHKGVDRKTVKILLEQIRYNIQNFTKHQAQIFEV